MLVFMLRGEGIPGEGNLVDEQNFHSRDMLALNNRDARVCDPHLEVYVTHYVFALKNMWRFIMLIIRHHTHVNVWESMGSLVYTVADSGGVREVQMHPPLAASNVFLRT